MFNQKKYMHEYYIQNKKQILIQNKEYRRKHKNRYKQTNKKHYLIGKQIMHNLKINGCSICGYNKCDKALHFHHIISRYKRFTITMTDIINSKRTNKQIIIELRKCILLCSNCHWEMEK